MKLISKLPQNSKIFLDNVKLGGNGLILKEVFYLFLQRTTRTKRDYCFQSTKENKIAVIKDRES